MVELFSTQAANHASRRRSGTNGAATPTAGLAGSCLLSSGSQLSQPAMSIPEEQSLPEEHSAMQLPPPLLPPIRKAYPSASGELRITPDMLNSPSPVRKVSPCQPPRCLGHWSSSRKGSNARQVGERGPITRRTHVTRVVLRK